LAAQHYFKVSATEEVFLSWVLAGEEAAAGRHLDNVAPCLFGGLTLSFFDGDIPVIRSFPIKHNLWIALVTPRVRVATRDARSVLSRNVSADTYCKGIANAAGVALALSHGDLDLLSFCLHDPYAEPARAPLVPHYYRAKEIALDHGALGFSLSGSGPTVFAACDRLEVANRVCEHVAELYLDIGCSTHIVQVADRGACVLDA
jgi:homoserine kinase